MSFLICLKIEQVANTFSQLYVHIVFAVKGRKSLINDSYKENLFKYITGIVTKRNQKLMIINGMPDHIHILIGYKPDCRLTDLVRDIKAFSSKWIKECKDAPREFEWQRGIGAFSVGYLQRYIVINYIRNQEQHHRRKSFRNEYIELLNESNIDYQPEYIFDENGAAPTELKN